jgi:hypothetical protein
MILYASAIARRRGEPVRLKADNTAAVVSGFSRTCAARMTVISQSMSPIADQRLSPPFGVIRG